MLQPAQEGSDGQRPGDGVEPAARRFGVLAVRKLAAELDMREDSMETVLSYLEADDCPCLRMLPTAALSVKVSFYAAGPEQLALQYPVVKVRETSGRVPCLPGSPCYRRCHRCRHLLLPSYALSHSSTCFPLPCLCSPCWRHAPCRATASTMPPPPSWQQGPRRRQAWCCRSCELWQQGASLGLSFHGRRGLRTRWVADGHACTVLQTTCPRCCPTTG